MHGDTITIRPLGPEDAHVLDRVRAGVFDPPLDPSLAWRFLAAGVNEMVIASERGEVVGYASGTVIMQAHKPPEMLVHGVGVHADLRRQGIGRRLLRRITDLAMDRGCVAVWTLSGTESDAARRLFAGMGGRGAAAVVHSWDE